MFDDPYKILGLTPDATDDEVKQAYRRLAKKYHPDVNPGDPVAAQKMNDINAAYDQIKNPPQNGGYQNPYGGAYNPFSGWQGQYYQQSYSSPLETAKHYIRYGSFQSALHVLSQMPEEQRTAEWYYLSAIANVNLGNRVTATEHIRKAVTMEPGNPIYARAQEQILNNGTVYEETRTRGFAGSAGTLRTCCYACALMSFCCGGRVSFLPCLFCC